MLLLTMPNERSIRPRWKASRRHRALTGREYGSRSRRLNMETLEDRRLLAGVIAEYPIPTPSSFPAGITAGPDGNLWFTEGFANKIGRITTSGAVTEFPTSSGPSGITAGPDGNLWFTEPEANKIGRITTSGAVTEFPIPTPASGLVRITAGPDGNLWFTEEDANKIGQLSPVPPPTVISVQRFGFHADPTRIVLGFSTGLDPVHAQDVHNYSIVGPGGQMIAVDTATYSPLTNTVVLIPHSRLNLHLIYRLTVNGSTPGGVTDRFGNLLDGAGNGLPGSNFVTNITASDLVLGTQVPGGPARLAHLRGLLSTVEANQSKQLARLPHSSNPHKATHGSPLAVSSGSPRLIKISVRHEQAPGKRSTVPK
jgi:Planctomycete extracellular